MTRTLGLPASVVWLSCTRACSTCDDSDLKLSASTSRSSFIVVSRSLIALSCASRARDWPSCPASSAPRASAPATVARDWINLSLVESKYWLRPVRCVMTSDDFCCVIVACNAAICLSSCVTCGDVAMKRDARSARLACRPSSCACISPSARAASVLSLYRRISAGTDLAWLLRLDRLRRPSASSASLSSLLLRSRSSCATAPATCAAISTMPFCC